MQDTLERACSKWRLWLAGSNLRALLFRVMHNLFVNQLRQSPARANLTRVDLDDLACDLHAVSSDPGLALDLQRCLLRLPPEQREVLLLVSLEDMSYAEVARVALTGKGSCSRASRVPEPICRSSDAPQHVHGKRLRDGLQHPVYRPHRLK